MRYAFIEEQRMQHSVRRMCEALDVSPAGYYEWRGRPPSARALADVDLRALIVRVHAESRRTYGRPRIHAELSAEGTRVGSKRVRRLMKAAGIEYSTAAFSQDHGFISRSADRRKRPGQRVRRDADRGDESHLGRRYHLHSNA
jgi:hypothetical protein